MRVRHCITEETLTQRTLTIATTLLMLGVLFQACDGRGDAEPTPTQSQTAAQDVALPEDYVEITVTNGGGIRGISSFIGSPPPQGVIQVTKDSEAFGNTIPNERLIVSANGMIKNVVVFIQEITEGKSLPTNLPSVTNRGGRFVDHVQVFPQREILIRSEDPVLHNTHPYFGRKEEGGRSLYNVAMSPPNEGEAKEVRRPLNRGAGMYQLRCDAHDWMRGWVWVLDHPYGAVSAEDGTFVIDDIPPGTYMLTAWHETLGEQEMEVTVLAGTTVDANFEFSQ